MMLFRVPLPVSWPFNVISLLSGLLKLFDISKGLTVHDCTFVLIYYTLTPLFASSTFFSIFITPLIYSKKSAISNFRQIIFRPFFDRVPENLDSLLRCLELFFIGPRVSCCFLRYCFFYIFLPQKLIPRNMFPIRSRSRATSPSISVEPF